MLTSRMCLRWRRPSAARDYIRRPLQAEAEYPSRTSPTASRRWRSRASARCRTCRRRTTGSSATSPSTLDRRARRAGSTWSTWPAARATAPPSWRAARRASRAWTPTRRRTSTRGSSTRAREPRFARDLVETYAGECDAVVFLQTIEHVENPEEVLDHFRSICGRRTAYVSTPNVLTLAPEGAEKSGNPWHVKEYRAEEFRALCEASFDHVEMHGLFHARKLWLHERAIRAAGTRSTRGSASRSPSTTGSRRRSATRDFALRRRAARPRARLRGRAQMSATAGALALVLHTHMPYVEGFDTWPFGEEWLWEAVAGVYLPLLDVLEGAPVTVGLTPVLCDQLETMRGDAGDRYLRFLREIRAPIHAEDSEGSTRTGKPELAASCAAPPATTRARTRSSSAAAATCSARSRALGTELWTSTATHAVLPLLATDAGLRLQVGHGHRVARAPLRRGLERRLLAARVRVRARARARPRRARRARLLRRPDGRARPRRARPSPAGRDRGRARWPCRSTGRPSSWSGATSGYPVAPATTATTTAARCTT